MTTLPPSFLVMRVGVPPPRARTNKSFIIISPFKGAKVPQTITTMTPTHTHGASVPSGNRATALKPQAPRPPAGETRGLRQQSSLTWRCLRALRDVHSSTSRCEFLDFEMRIPRTGCNIPWAGCNIPCFLADQNVIFPAFSADGPFEMSIPLLRDANPSTSRCEFLVQDVTFPYQDVTFPAFSAYGPFEMSIPRPRDANHSTARCEFFDFEM